MLSAQRSHSRCSFSWWVRSLLITLLLAILTVSLIGDRPRVAALLPRVLPVSPDPSNDPPSQPSAPIITSQVPTTSDSASPLYSQHECYGRCPAIGCPRLWPHETGLDRNQNTKDILKPDEKGKLPVKFPNVTCRFRNVCYDLRKGTNNEFLYFAPPVRERSLNLPNCLGIGGYMPTCSGIFHARVVESPIPAAAAVFIKRVVINVKFLLCTNFGHALRDAMFYAFVLLETFHIPEPFDSHIFATFGAKLSEMAHCFKRIRELYAALSKHPVLTYSTEDLSTLREVYGMTSNQSLLCFDTFLTGSGPLTLLDFTRRHLKEYAPQIDFEWPIYYRFRNYLMNNLVGPQCLDTMHIIFAKKLNVKRCQSSGCTGAGILNSDDLKLAMKPLFPAFIVESLDFGNLSFKEQVELTSRTKVLFSHGGGGSYNALFLPVRATLALMDKHKDDLFFFSSLEWFTVVKLPSHCRPKQLCFMQAGLKLGGHIAEDIIRKALANSTNQSCH